MMNKVQSLLKKVDLLSTSQLLRYRGQSQYSTSTGGCVSVSVIVICAILFANLGVMTLRRDIIYTSTSYQIDYQPQPVQFNFNTENRLMVAVGINGLNLSDPNIKYFDIEMRQNFYTPVYRLIDTKIIPLSQCTIQHFSFDQNTKTQFYNLKLDRQLCPPLDFKFNVGGKISSNLLSQINIFVSKCNSSLYSNCANSSQLAAHQASYGTFTLTVPCIKSLVNPSNKDYISIFLQDRNYFHFTLSSNMGMEIIAQIEQYKIETDKSIMPYTQVQYQSILTFPNAFVSRNLPVFSNTIINVRFTKSSRTTTFQRSFKKIDDYLSYIGGLIGTVLLFFFFISKYSQNAYLMSCSSQIFKGAEDQPNREESYNFISYILMFLHSILSFFKIPIKWPKTQQFIENVQQMELQLSIQRIQKRIMLLEGALSCLITNDEIAALSLIDKPSLQYRKQMRKKEQILLQFKKKKEKIINRQNQHEQRQSKVHLINQDLNKTQYIKELPQPHIIRLDLQNQAQLGNSLQFIDNNKQRETQHEEIRQQIQRVIKLRDEGNVVSSRIIQKINKNLLKQLGIKQRDDCQLTSRKINIRRKSSIGKEDNSRLKQQKILKSDGEEFQFNMIN